MKLHDLKRTKAERKAAEEPREQGSGYEEHPHVELEDHHLEKLGIKEMPRKGDEFHGEFRGRVTETHESDDKAYGPPRRIRMALHHMGVENRDGPGDEDDEGNIDKSDRRSRAGLRGAVEKAAMKVEKAQ